MNMHSLSRAMIWNELDSNVFDCDVTFLNIQIFRRESIIGQIGSQSHSLFREGKHFDWQSYQECSQWGVNSTAKKTNIAEAGGMGAK